MSEILLENISFSYDESEDTVFNNLSINLPHGLVSLVGQNGSGKSTLLLLASGITLPQQGEVLIKGVNTRELRDEQARHRYVSYIYQNMEFETEDTVGDLLEFVYEGGFDEKKDPALVPEIIKVFELDNSLGKKTQEVSKGELQRIIIAFSILYGSYIMMMDEPIFALEQHQKHKVMEYLCDFSKKHKKSVYYSAHELDITRKYSENVLLFYKDCHPELGETEKMLSKDMLEKAYDIPYSMLKDQESLFLENIGVKYKP